MQHAINVHLFGLDRERGARVVTMDDVVSTRLMLFNSWGMISEAEEGHGLMRELRKLLAEASSDDENLTFAARCVVMLQTHVWAEAEMMDTHALILEATPTECRTKAFITQNLGSYETHLAHVRAHWQSAPGTMAPPLSSETERPQ